jgi:hypothetical protein
MDGRLGVLLVLLYELIRELLESVLLLDSMKLLELIRDGHEDVDTSGGQGAMILTVRQYTQVAGRCTISSQYDTL